MDKDRRVSIETTSALFVVSVGTVHTIIHGELEMRKICTKFLPRVLREDQKERRCHDSREMVELINLDPAVLDALVTCDESWIFCYDPETKTQSYQEGQISKSTRKLLMIPFFDSTVMIYMHWVPTIVQTYLPVTFGYSLSSEAVLMKQLKRWKRLWRRGFPWSLLEVVGTVQQGD